MLLRDFTKKLFEGGNLEIDGVQAQQIDLKVHNRAYIIPILSTLLDAINAGYQQSVGGPLWNPKVLKSRKYLSGSSIHFFNTDLPDDEFERVKPKVGDIDTQVNKASEQQLTQYLDSVKGQVVGNAKFLGYSRGNEQYSSLWELTDPPIKVQIDFEFVDYSDKDEPTDWAGFSHSSSWDDLSQGIKGVFHKFLIQSLSKISSQEFILRKTHKRTGKITDKPEKDSMISFAVSSKEGGGLRAKYEPVLDDNGQPLEINGLPVLKELPPAGYEKDIGKIFQAIFDKRIDSSTLKKVLPKTWSFVGLLELMNLILSDEEKENVLDSFVDKMFAPGAQGLYKGDPERDLKEKNTALNYALKVLAVTPPKNLEQMRQDYVKNYKVTTEGPVGLDKPIEEAEGEQPAVKAQLRKGMPHLRDLKPADFLDLVDELRADGGRFKLQNIPLNVKIDGFGGRFGKNAEGKPFMGTSRTEPRYSAGFLDYHKQKGTDDPEILGRAANFDKLFNEMMDAIEIVDNKMGEDFLVDKQVTCEVLFLPFATQTEEGKLKFIGIEYDQFPQGVELVIVPYRIVQASTGEDIPNGDKIAQQIAELGQSSSVMFVSNRLVQKDGLDVTKIINPLDNLEELKRIVTGTAGKRDRESIELRREVEAKLKPVQIALEKAIDEDPNIVGKDNLGQEYEGIVINTRLGPVKVTSQRQKDLITQKNAARAAARTDQGRENKNKTAVVAVGSFIGHKGHEELFNYTIDKAKELNGDPYLFIGNAEGKDDPIPPAVKVQTWHKLYPQYAKNISTVIEGGSLLQKIKHELINPLPGKPPRYDNIVIMVGEDRAGMTMPNALMKAVNKFQGYEHVKASLGITPRGTGISGTMLRNSLKNDPPEKALATWSNAFDVNKLGVDWIKHLMEITRKGMGIKEPTEPKQQPAQQPASPTPIPVSEMRLFNSLVRPIKEVSDVTKKSYKEKATAQVKELEPWTKKGEYKDIAQRAIDRRNKGLERVKDIKEDVKLAGLTTGLSDPENPIIRDNESYKYFSPDEFFAKFPQFNRQEWEQALVKQKEKSKANADLKKKQTATNISGIPITPDEAEKEKQYLLKVLSPEQQAEYKKLYNAGDRDSMFKAGRLLKQAWGAKVKQDEMKKLVKVHWTGVNDLQKFLSGGMSNKTEISAVMYKSKDEIPNKPNWTGGSTETIGLIIDGWTTMAGGMDLASDNQRVGKGEVGKTRSDQKYSFMPDRIETDPSKMRTTKAELGSEGWNEATVDNWRVVGIVLPDGVSQSTVDAVNATKLPITDVRTKQQAVGEFAPAGGGTPPRGPKTPERDPWGGGDDGPGDDPYSRPEPEYYSRSIDFFGQFEADHFDKEDFNEKTGVFKGYWDYDGELKQIAYFKFDDPRQAARDFDDSPGMGWYYEPVEESVAEGSLGEVLPWPEVANKISSAMKAMGWKAQRKGDDSFMFSTKGAEDESQWYMVMIDNEGDGMFSYALGTFEGGRPDIGEQDTLPTTEASVSEVIMAIRDGYGLNEQGVAETDSPAMAQVARRLTDPNDGKVAKLRAAGDKRREDQLKGRDIANRDRTSKDEWGNLKEKMLPKSVFAGTKAGQKVGSAGQWKNTGASKNRPARAGDLVGGSAEESIQRGVPVSEDVENIFASLINKIIVNEAIQNHKR